MLRFCVCTLTHFSNAHESDIQNVINSEAFGEMKDGLSNQRKIRHTKRLSWTTF